MNKCSVNAVGKKLIGNCFSVASGGRSNKGMKKASSAICVLENSDGGITRGVGVLYPDIDHLFFVEYNTMDPEKLWFMVHALTKISPLHLCDEAVALIVAIMSESAQATDLSFEKAYLYLAYGYTAEKLREETFAQKPPKEEIERIVVELNLLRVPINNPFAKVAEVQKSEEPGFFQQLAEQTLAFAV